MTAERIIQDAINQRKEQAAYWHRRVAELQANEVPPEHIAAIERLAQRAEHEQFALQEVLWTIQVTVPFVAHS